MKEVFSKQQIVDGSGHYLTQAMQSGFMAQRDSCVLPCPTYGEAAQSFDISPTQPFFQLKRVTEYNERLRALGGLRVIAAIRAANKNAFVPGVVLPDRRAQARIGCLVSAHDIRSTSVRDATSLITPFQQLLLANIAAQHGPQVGKHVEGQPNGAEIGQGVLVAAAKDPHQIHAKVHQFSEEGSLSTNITAMGAADLQMGHETRRHLSAALPLGSIAALIVTKENQVPWPLDGDGFDVSVGFTHAARQSQPNAPRIDVTANLDGLLRPL